MTWPGVRRGQRQRPPASAAHLVRWISGSRVHSRGVRVVSPPLAAVPSVRPVALERLLPLPLGICDERCVRPRLRACRRSSLDPERRCRAPRLGRGRGRALTRDGRYPHGAVGVDADPCGACSNSARSVRRTTHRHRPVEGNERLRVRVGNDERAVAIDERHAVWEPSPSATLSYAAVGRDPNDGSSASIHVRVAGAVDDELG